MNRRDILHTFAGAAAATVGAPAIAHARRIAPMTWSPRRPGTHGVVPLPFDPKALRGISEKMIVSHHDNNYVAAVKNLNKVELDLEKVNKDTPGYAVSGLRERELTFTNSMNLHERYFANLGGDGKGAGSAYEALGRQFGSQARWEELFRATALSLGGGSGWCVVALSRLTGDLRIIASRGHDQAVVAGEPLLVLDMFEHAYQMDYGAAHAKYVDAFFANLNWAVVAQRFDAAVAGLVAVGGATGISEGPTPPTRPLPGAPRPNPADAARAPITPVKK